jgi:hypothetical protein
MENFGGGMSADVGSQQEDGVWGLSSLPNPANEIK